MAPLCNPPAEAGGFLQDARVATEGLKRANVQVEAERAALEGSRIEAAQRVDATVRFPARHGGHARSCADAPPARPDGKCCSSARPVVNALMLWCFVLVADEACLLRRAVPGVRRRMLAQPCNLRAEAAWQAFTLAETKAKLDEAEVITPPRRGARPIRPSIDCRRRRVSCVSLTWRLDLTVSVPVEELRCAARRMNSTSSAQGWRMQSASARAPSASECAFRSFLRSRVPPPTTCRGLSLAFVLWTLRVTLQQRCPGAAPPSTLRRQPPRSRSPSRRSSARVRLSCWRLQPPIVPQQSSTRRRCAYGPAIPAPAQMWQEAVAQSRCSRGSGEPSPGADVAGASPVPVQMWQGQAPVPAQMWASAWRCATASSRVVINAENWARSTRSSPTSNASSSRSRLACIKPVPVQTWQARAESRCSGQG